MPDRVYIERGSDGKLRPVRGAVYNEPAENSADMRNHNPRVGGSSPSSATNFSHFSDDDWSGLQSPVNFPFGPNVVGQNHYTELSLEKRANYAGPEDRCSDAEIMAGLATFLNATGLPGNLPLPPFGLVGHNGNPDPEVMRIIREGVGYLRALCQGERKTLWKIHDRIAETLRQAYWDGHRTGYEKCAAEYAAEFTRNPGQAVEGMQRRAAETSVYFIKSESGGIKIGMATDVASRLRTLQTAHPAKLTVLAVTTGGQPAERAYHVQFAEHRLHGEWFTPHDDILAEIERLQTPPRKAGARGVQLETESGEGGL